MVATQRNDATRWTWTGPKGKRSQQLRRKRKDATQDMSSCSVKTAPLIWKDTSAAKKDYR